VERPGVEDPFDHPQTTLAEVLLGQPAVPEESTQRAPGRTASASTSTQAACR
jgi:hypothetical protein